MILQLFHRARRTFVDALAILRPHLVQFVEQIFEANAPRRVLRRIIRAAVKRLQLRREKHAHRPAAVAARRLHISHVRQIHIRPLLAVHLDGNEVLVDQLRRLLVLKRLTLHHMAPVAGRVAGGEKDRLVLRLRLFESLVAPRQPVHRIVGMLQQVGRALLGEGVGKFGGLAGRIAHGWG